MLKKTKEKYITVFNMSDRGIWLSGNRFYGPYLEWYDGCLMKKYEYKDGKRHGEHINYFTSGQLMDKTYWKDDEKITEEEYNELF